MIAQHRRGETGIKRLVRKYVHQFRIPENLDHYSPEDFERAEKQFIKHCLREGYVMSRKGT